VGHWGGRCNRPAGPPPDHARDAGPWRAQGGPPADLRPGRAGGCVGDGRGRRGGRAAAWPRLAAARRGGGPGGERSSLCRPFRERPRRRLHLQPRLRADPGQPRNREAARLQPRGARRHGPGHP